MPEQTIDRPDLGQLAQRSAELATEIREMRETPEADRTDTFARELRDRAAQLNATDAEIAHEERQTGRDWQQLLWDQAVAAEDEQRQRLESLGPEAAFLTEDGRDVRGPVADALSNSDAYREWRERSGDRRGSFPEIELRLGDREARALLDSGTGSGAAGVLRTVLQPIPPTPRQMNLVLRDLIPSTTVGASSGAIPYVRETNPATNETGATAVVEGAAKPEVTMEFDDALAVIAKIAAWVPVTEEILADAPLLRGYVENRLLYMLNFREQDQFLNGGGGAANIEGLLVVSGTQTIDGTENVDGDVPATLALAFGNVENVDAQANGVVENPIDYWTAVATRHANQFDGDANGTAPIGAPPQTTWGVPTVRTRAMSAGTALVGDFQLGAMIVDRQTATLRTADQHDDYFVKNKVVVLVEKRVALPIFRPDVFCVVTIDHTP